MALIDRVYARNPDGYVVTDNGDVTEPAWFTIVRKCLAIAFFLGIVLTFAGLWLDFVPTEGWASKGLRFSLSCAVLLTGAYYWACYTGKINLQKHRRTTNISMLIVGIPCFAFGLLWISVVHAIPGLLTMQAGTPHTETAIFKKVHSTARRECDHQVTSDVLGRAFPNHMCISASKFRQLPDTAFEAVFHGKTTSFGFYIQRVGDPVGAIAHDR